MNSLSILCGAVLTGGALRFLYLALSTMGVFAWFEARFFDLCYFCLGAWSAIPVAVIVHTVTGWTMPDAQLLAQSCVSAALGVVIYYQLLLTDEV